MADAKSARRPRAGTEAGTERLARIAELVGCPVESFRAPGSAALNDALELVKLWERTDASGRARLLDCARAEAMRTGGPEEIAPAEAGLRRPLG